MYPCLSLRYYRGSEAARKLSSKRFLFMTRARTYTYCVHFPTQPRHKSDSLHLVRIVRFMAELGADCITPTCTNVWFTLIASPEASISQMSSYISPTLIPRRLFCCSASVYVTEDFGSGNQQSML